MCRPCGSHLGFVIYIYRLRVIYVWRERGAEGACVARQQAEARDRSAVVHLRLRSEKDAGARLRKGTAD